MSYNRLKQAVTELEIYMNEQPNVDDHTLSRLELLREQLVNFISVGGEATEPVDEADEWDDLVEIVEKEIVTSRAKHPELARKLDDVLLSASRTGI